MLNLKDHYKKSFFNWINVSDLDNCVAINLTFKMWHNHQKLDEIIAAENYQMFLKFLSCKCYRSAAKRFGKRVKQINVFERVNDRWHTHGLMQKPTHLSNEAFEKLIISSWLRTDWGNRIHTFDWNLDLGWVHYITKFKSDADHIDFLNYTWFAE
jgi:hypothetical protein